VRAAVFDFDGVLVDSEPLHFQATREALLPDGVDITTEEYYTSLIGYDDWGTLRQAFQTRGISPTPERLQAAAERKKVAFADSIVGVRFFPGARELVRALGAEIPLAIASGARREEIEAILRAGGLRDAFTAVVGAEDAPRTKPDPAPYLEAARLLEPHAPGLVPAQCVAFEDTVAGVVAALGAGMKVVAVTTSYPAEKLRSAHRVVDSLAALERGALEALFAAR
jgi:HAD superfamily hydrolase (TIGR01509 family)